MVERKPNYFIFYHNSSTVSWHILMISDKDEMKFQYGLRYLDTTSVFYDQLHCM